MRTGLLCWLARSLGVVCHHLLLIVLSAGLLTGSGSSAAFADIASFAWPEKMLASKKRYHAAIQVEEDAQSRLKKAEINYQARQQSHSEALAALGLRDKAWQGNRLLAAEKHRIERAWQQEASPLQRNLRVSREKLAKFQGKKQALQHKEYIIPALRRAKLQALDLQIKDVRDFIAVRETLLVELTTQRDAKLAKLAGQQPLRPSTEIYGDIFKASDALFAAAQELEQAQVAYQKAGGAAKLAIFDYLSWMENTRPPFVRRLRILHGKQDIYDAMWVADASGEANSQREQKILQDQLRKEETVLTFSKKRIALLEKNRTSYRTHMNAVRAEAQVLQQAISDIQVAELYAKVAIELAVLTAEIYLTGGALTAATHSAGLSVKRAVRTYSQEFAKEFAKQSVVSKEVAAIIAKLTSEATVKQIEDAIGESYDNRGYSGLQKTIGSEVTEWAFGEAIGKGFEALHDGVASKASKQALAVVAKQTANSKNISKVTGLVKLVDAVETAGTAEFKASLATAAAEITAKVALDYAVGNRVDALGTQKVVKQVEVIVTQAIWNRVHLALLKERLRAAHIEARIDAIKLRLAQGRQVLKLQRPVVKVLRSEDLAKKHVIDIFFETSERLRYTPSIKAFAGFAVEDIKRAPKLGPNWWQAFAVLDEEQLSSVSELPITIHKSTQYSPYAAFDADPSSIPVPVNRNDPSWKGYEPGPDRWHKVMLELDKEENKIDLTGDWIGYGYNCDGETSPQSIRIREEGDQVIALKLSGDPCVPAGNVTWQGTRKGGAIHAELTATYGPGKPLFTVKTILNVLDKDTIILPDNDQVKYQRR